MRQGHEGIVLQHRWGKEWQGLVIEIAKTLNLEIQNVNAAPNSLKPSR